MPTGYTHKVQSGEITTLRDYALTCARGMGALIMMRDEPFDAQIPEKLKESTDYRDGKLSELLARWDEVTNYTPQECASEAGKEHLAAINYRDDYLKRQAEERQRYESMLAQVREWSTEAEGIREFMIEQLQSSIRFDCGGSYEPPVPDLLTGEEWLEVTKAKILKDIDYHEGEQIKEAERTAERQAWLDKLRASLPPVKDQGQ
jgi:hypothetical protein